MSQVGYSVLVLKQCGWRSWTEGLFTRYYKAENHDKRASPSWRMRSAVTPHCQSVSLIVRELRPPRHNLPFYSFDGLVLLFTTDSDSYVAYSLHHKYWLDVTDCIADLLTLSGSETSCCDVEVTSWQSHRIVEKSQCEREYGISFAFEGMCSGGKWTKVKAWQPCYP